ncbi:DUF3995 domain-containing protein [Enterovibrio sp. 27052020O]|uniref:DUF3995 domain-containing protein n=1 Tax=Enterovibrio sp. 27052020O TaxID=3241166 RepID=UPI00388FEDA6
MKLLAIVMAFFLLLAAFIHVYWALGGRRGVANAIPMVEGERAFTPGAFVTLLVAAGLTFFGLLSLSLAGLISLPIWLSSYLQIIGFIVAGIFLLRAVGDFKLVGFSKKIKGSPFAVWDSRLYSPLCLFLGAGYVYLSWMA